MNEFGNIPRFPQQHTGQELVWFESDDGPHGLLVATQVIR